MEEYLIVTFTSTNFAMQAENVLKSAEIKHQIIPTPRQITLSCGLSIMLSIENLGEIKELIYSKKIINKSIYRVSSLGKEKTLDEIGG